MHFGHLPVPLHVERALPFTFLEFVDRSSVEGVNRFQSESDPGRAVGPGMGSLH
jgi:hypothetical protein